LTCLEKRIPVVSGTTGWIEKQDEIERKCRELNGTFFYASNFSIGVNILFKVNKILAGIMNNHQNYQPAMLEIHHTEKKDAPSGTAISLAEGIIENMDRIKSWSNTATENPDVLEIESKRIGQVPGTHSIKYRSTIDEITLKHEAFGREGFAMGAILVAEWLKDKHGVLNMNDFLLI
jgi:4-hydroxy-tetrahydrodipicolinate reductase